MMARVNTSTTYVLVKWLDEESWDVLPVKNCVKDIRPSIQDGTVVGTVADFYWRKGEESAPCKILAYGKEKEMERQLEQFTNDQPGPSVTVPEVLGVGQRAIKRPTRLAQSDDDVEEAEEPKKKKKPTATATSHNIIKQLADNRQSADAQQPSPCKCRKYNALKDKYAAIKKEKASLQDKVDELLKYKELHSVVGRLEKCAATMAAAPTNGSTVRETSQPENSPDGQDQKVEVKMKASTKVDIGNGVVLEKAKLMAINQGSNTATILARNLFVSLFRREAVLGRSITGRPSNAHRETAIQKERLDPVKVGSIIDYTMKKFPGASASMIRQSLANKIKEMGKAQ